MVEEVAGVFAKEVSVDIRRRGSRTVSAGAFLKQGVDPVQGLRGVAGVKDLGVRRVWGSRVGCFAEAAFGLRGNEQVLGAGGGEAIVCLIN